MDTRIKIVVLLIVMIGISVSTIAAQSRDKEGKDHLDPSIRYRRLPNGFTYYIKPMHQPQSKLNLRFFVKAGYAQQDPDQMNMAHAIEHLAFKASQNLPQGIREYIHSTNIGARDIGGSAESKGVKYFFDMPQNSKEAWQTGLLWFKEIATGLKLSRSDVDKERGVLCQELIYRAGDKLNESFLDQSLMAQLLPCEQEDSNFFEHHRTFPVETLRRFYRDWYRPDLMALSIVGNIKDVDAMEKQLIDWFSDISPHNSPRKPVDCDSIYYARPPQFVKLERKPDTLKRIANKDVLFRLFFRDPLTKEKLEQQKGANRLMTWQLLTNILRERFNNASNVYNSTISINGTHTYKLEKAPPALMVNITTGNFKEKEALLKTIEILQQLKKYGISKTEWENAKNGLLQSLNSTNLENPNYWIKGIEKHYIRGEGFPPHKNDHLKRWLSQLSLKGFNDLVSKLYLDMPEDIGIIAPTGHRALSYTERQVRSWIRGAYSNTIQPNVFPQVPVTLIPSSKLAKLDRKEYKDNGNNLTGSRELLLENGVKVILKSFKPTPGLNANRVIMHGYSPKGASCFPEVDYYSAINAPTIVQNAGVGEMDKFQLNRFLSKTSLEQGLRPYIDFMETGITGDATVEDVEIMLQLVYLYFTEPRKDVVAFEDWKRTQRRTYKSPPYGLAMADFNNEIRETVGDNSVSDGDGLIGTRLLLGTKQYQGIDRTFLDRGHAIYRQLFGNPQDFTFLISGEFEIKSMLPLVQKYLGNLPEIKNSLECNSHYLGATPLSKGPLYKEFPAPKMYDIKNVMYTMKFIQRAATPYNWQEQLKIRTLGVLTDLKVKRLRNEKGFSLYDFGSMGKFNKALSQYEISLEFNCVSDELAGIQKECKKIISEIKSGTITNVMFEQSKKELHFLYDLNVAGQHQPIQLRLFEYYRYQIPWIAPTEVEQFLKSLTVEDLVETANKYFNEEQLFEFVMGN